MPLAYIPSPARNLWHLGPVPVRAYAICVVAGVIAGLWVANRRYARIGGRPGLILDIATLALPAGLAGARLYSVVTNYQLYFAPGKDWANVFRIWDGGLGVPGAVIGGGLSAWVICRREGAALAPIAGAVAPGLAFAQAIGRLGDWFNQALYGNPTTLPWAVEISPVHRLAGYVNYATFQPTFLYESLWDAMTGMLVIWAARRFLLTGDRAFAVYLGLYAVGRFLTQILAIDYSLSVFGLRIDQVLMSLIVVGAIAYLSLTRNERGPDSVTGSWNSGSAAPAPGASGTGTPAAGDTSAQGGPRPLGGGAAGPAPN